MSPKTKGNLFLAAGKHVNDDVRWTKGVSGCSDRMLEGMRADSDLFSASCLRAYLVMIIEIFPSWRAY